MLGAFLLVFLILIMVITLPRFLSRHKRKVHLGLSENAAPPSVHKDD